MQGEAIVDSSRSRIGQQLRFVAGVKGRSGSSCTRTRRVSGGDRKSPLVANEQNVGGSGY